MTSTQGKTPYRTTARIVGVLYLARFAVGVGGMTMIQSVLGVPGPLAAVSTGAMTVAVGCVLWLTAVTGDVAHGVLLFPILKRRSERIAIGYLAGRIVDAVFIAVMVLFILLQLPLASEYLTVEGPAADSLEAVSAMLTRAGWYAYEIGMSALGVVGTMLCYALHRAKLLPAFLTIWGMVGYAVLLVGMLSSLAGSGLRDLSVLPGGLWEAFAGVWLLTKGFDRAGFVADPAAGHAEPVPDGGVTGSR